MRQVVYLVECLKGDAIFLEHSRADEYAIIYKGTVVPFYRHVQETPNNSSNLRQEGQAASSGSEQLPKDTSPNGESISGSESASEAIPACRDCSPGEIEGLEQGPSHCGDPLQQFGAACQC